MVGEAPLVVWPILEVKLLRPPAFQPPGGARWRDALRFISMGRRNDFKKWQCCCTQCTLCHFRACNLISSSLACNHLIFACKFIGLDDVTDSTKLKLPENITQSICHFLRAILDHRQNITLPYVLPEYSFDRQNGSCVVFLLSN